ncbi:MAG TPA: AAA family ATPase [Myxococcota bacterium]|nr:AAA family ATPase [Myxococcota bacterium]
MDDRTLQRERAQNLWASFERKFPAVAHATRLDAAPDQSTEEIGGLAAAKEEILTYACAATSPEVYERWGTQPPHALLLIGQPGVGKTLLVRLLATRAETAFLRVEVPLLVLQVVHATGSVSELLAAWTQALGEMPPVTVFFDELEFSRAQEIGARRPDLPIGPIMDFLLDLVDRTIAAGTTLVAGSTSHPDTLRPAFLAARRFERIVEVLPSFPDDIVATLRVHAESAQKRAGRQLFDAVDWLEVVKGQPGLTPGEWVRLLHAVLRRKARCDAAGEPVTPVATRDLMDEVERFRRASIRIPHLGTYV